jgi:hypothetical protein
VLGASGWDEEDVPFCAGEGWGRGFWLFGGGGGGAEDEEDDLLSFLEELESWELFLLS